MEIFSTRVVRVVFIAGETELSFQEVARVIDIAARRADYVAIVTPTVERKAEWREGMCIDPNIKFPNILM